MTVTWSKEVARSRQRAALPEPLRKLPTQPAPSGSPHRASSALPCPRVSRESRLRLSDKHAAHPMSRAERRPQRCTPRRAGAGTHSQAADASRQSSDASLRFFPVCERLSRNQREPLGAK